MPTRCLGWLLRIVLAALASFAGCGSDGNSARPDVDAISQEEHFGMATKQLVYDFRARVRKNGVSAAKKEIAEVLENFDGYEKHALGQHAATYKEIVEKLKALQASLGSSPSRDAVVKAAEEIGALADKLPGKVDANPVVE